MEMVPRYQRQVSPCAKFATKVPNGIFDNYVNDCVCDSNKCDGADEEANGWTSLSVSFFSSMIRSQPRKKPNLNQPFSCTHSLLDPYHLQLCLY